MADTPSQQSPGLLANILAVAGFIILIVIIVWGAYHLLRLTGSGVSSLFSRFTNKENTITLTAPTTSVTAGKSFPLTWKYTPSESGTYAFLYQCKAGFRFDVTTPSGATSPIPCGNAFTIGTNTNTTLTPMLSGTSTIDVPISVVFMPSATTSTARPQGTATVRVVIGSGTTPSTTTPKPSTGSTTPKPTTPSTGTTHVAGPADLSVSITAVGVIDPISGAFMARSPMNPNEISAVQFDIGNRGGTSTGTWYFTVQLPVNGSYTYVSPPQMSLAPGAHIANTLRFKPVNSGGGMISVLVDTQNLVRESNEANNASSMWVNAQTWNGYPYQQPYVY